MKALHAALPSVFFLLVTACAADTRFVIVQPGYPGSTSEAETFISDLSRAISKGGGPVALEGEYYNDEKEALQAIARTEPVLGIVSLGFYLAHRTDLRLEPLLDSRPWERFYLAARKGEAVAPPDLEGKAVAGTPFKEMDFVRRIVFGPRPPGPGGDTPPAGRAVDVGLWKVQPTESFSKAVREVVRGKASAVLLNERERRALKEMAVGKELEVHYRTEELPTALVVAFGAPGQAARTAQKALGALKETQEGREILSTMGIESFAPPDREKLARLESRYHSQSRSEGQSGKQAKGTENGAQGGGR